MDQTLQRKKQQDINRTPPPADFRPNKLPRHLAKRQKLRLKYSKALLMETPTSQLDRTFLDIDGKRRQHLVEWFNEVTQLKKDLFNMEKSLQGRLVGANKGAKEIKMKRSKRHFKLPDLSEQELKGMPLFMRPRPKNLPPELQDVEKNWAEINTNSFEVLRFKLSDVRSQKLPSIPTIGEQYRILLTPDPIPELKTIRTRAHIAALNSLDQEKHGLKKKRKDPIFVSQGHINNVSIQEAKLKQTKPNRLPPISVELGDTGTRENILVRYKKEKQVELKLQSSNEKNCLALETQQNSFVMVDKVPKVSKHNQHRKINNVSKKVLHKKLKNLKDQNSEKAGKENTSGSKSNSERVLGGYSLALIQENADKAVDNKTASKSSRDIDQTDEEYYRKRPEFEIITINDVKKSRLIRGYNPPEMEMPKDIGHFIFDKQKSPKEEDGKLIEGE